MGDAVVAQANATVDIVHEIATILDTGLSKEEVAIIIALIENGVNPQASLILAFSPVLQLLLLKLSRWVHWVVYAARRALVPASESLSVPKVPITVLLPG